MSTHHYTCIVCPKSCSLTLTETDGEVTVIGQECPNGEKYARNEFTDPKRVLTTTVAVSGASLPLIPVVSDGEVSKAKLRACLDYLYQLKITAPITAGEIIVKNILDTGTNIIAARSLTAKN